MGANSMDGANCAGKVAARGAAMRSSLPAPTCALADELAEALEAAGRGCNEQAFSVATPMSTAT